MRVDVGVVASRAVGSATVVHWVEVLTSCTAGQTAVASVVAGQAVADPLHAVSVLVAEIRTGFARNRAEGGEVRAGQVASQGTEGLLHPSFSREAGD